MSKEEADTILAGLEEYAEETLSTPEKALEALIEAGIATQDGTLSKHYQA